MKRFFINNLLLLTTIFLILCISSCDINNGLPTPEPTNTPERIIHVDGSKYRCISDDELSIDDCLPSLGNNYYPDKIWSIDIKQEYKIKRLTICVPNAVNNFLNGDVYRDFNNDPNPDYGYCYVINYDDTNNMPCVAKIYIIFKTIPVGILEKYDNKMDINNDINENVYLYYDMNYDFNEIKNEFTDFNEFSDYYIAFNEGNYITRNILISSTDDFYAYIVYYGPNTSSRYEFDTSIFDNEIIKKCEKDDFNIYKLYGKDLSIDDCLSMNKIKLS